MKCEQSLFSLINTCEALKEEFPCKICSISFGLEQPAYVSANAPPSAVPGECLYSSMPERTTCSSSHSSTIRLCACTAL